MTQLDILLTRLHKTRRAARNAAFAHPLYVEDVDAIIEHLERLKALDAGVEVLIHSFAPEPTNDVETDATKV